MFAPQLDPELSPGDIFGRDWDNDRAVRLGPVVVFSHGCEVDKCQTVHVASLVSDSDTDPSLLGNIRSGRVWHALYLPGCAEPGWINLRTLRPMERQLLLERLDRRLHSMTDVGRNAIATKFFQFLTRTLPAASP